MDSKDSFVPQQKDPRSKLQLFFELNRLHKFPAGSDLVFWPCAWALAMASYRNARPPWTFFVDFVLYAFLSTLVHSAACVLNDICDRKLDAQERTKNRPIACGAISVAEASRFLSIQVAVGLAILMHTGDVVKYTNWPQAWLGLAMNWGFVVVWVHLVPEDKTYTLPAAFFAGTVCWTIVYDTIYACQDRVDDIKAGNHSTAVLFGDYVRPILALFAAAFVAAIAYAGVLNHQGPWFYLVAVGGTAAHLSWQLITLRPEVAADCWSKFKSNGQLGYITFAGIALDYFMKLRAN
ncbi:hypothetical protein H0H92_002815 [Tricholoma furcatifolium]|nr:hypothetical protein H0H92_002815 [Tricholoma furcatifolium]